MTTYRNNFSTVKFCLLVFTAVCVFALPSAQTQIVDTRGMGELKKGDYENAIKILNARITENPNDVLAQKALLRGYVETGRYTEAEAAAKKFLPKTRDGAVRYELAEVLALTGRYTEAIAELERAAADAERPGDKLASDLRRAELLELTGQEDRANTIYASFVKFYTDNDPQLAGELTLIARALVHLERFHDANDMYRSAVDADSSYIHAHIGAA